MEEMEESIPRSKRSTVTRRTKGTHAPVVSWPSGALNKELTGKARAKEVLKAIKDGEVTAREVNLAKPKMVKDYLTKIGFTESAAKEVVAELLHSQKVKPADRLAAADKVFKVLGTYAPEKSISLNLSLAKDENPKTKALREEYERKLKESLSDESISP